MASVPPFISFPLLSQICRGRHRKSGSESPFWNAREPSSIYDLPRNLNRNSRYLIHKIRFKTDVHNINSRRKDLLSFPVHTIVIWITSPENDILRV
jgi:hypothetical protein